MTTGDLDDVLDLAPQVVADLDALLVVVRCVIDLVISARLEEEMADLARGHRDNPAQQGGRTWINEQERVAGHEADRTQQVQRLVDPAVMVIPVIVPALQVQLFAEAQLRVAIGLVRVKAHNGVFRATKKCQLRDAM